MHDHDLRIDTFRGPGPGGQHRNTSDTGIRITHQPTGLVATVTRGRSQLDNRTAAKAILAARVAEQATRANKQYQAHQRAEQRDKFLRVYDEVRDMVREADGHKIRGLKPILDGQLEQLTAFQHLNQQRKSSK